MPESFGSITQMSTLWAIEIPRSNGTTVLYREQAFSEQPLVEMKDSVSLHLHTTTTIQNLSYSNFSSIFDRFY